MPPPRRPLRSEDIVGDHLTAQQKHALADVALALRDEQLQARIVHYKADLETSPELDAITAQVVAELRELQAQAPAGKKKPADEDPGTVLCHGLADLLGRVFRADETSMLVERTLQAVGRAIARLYFESQLHEKTRAAEARVKTIDCAEQGVLYALRRYSHRMHEDLAGFEYASEDARRQARELLERTEKDLRMAFLSRRSGELERMLKLLHAVLLDFFRHRLPGEVGAIALRAVACSGVADRQEVGYKLRADNFAAFRHAFEAEFLTRLVDFAEDELLPKVAAGDLHDETVDFWTDPALFSRICELVCGALYELLYNEGWLDLPPQWRAELLSRPDG